MEGPTEKVRVLRAFLHKGERVEPSEKPITLPKLLAIELQAARKAVILKEEPKADDPPPDTSGAKAPEPEKGKGKGAAHAR